MTEDNERMRAALREIESRAATALANQPTDADECGRHLNKALAGIELKAHVARWGQEGYPPPDNRESPGAGRAIASTAKRGSEADCSRVAVNPWRKRGRARILGQ